MGKYRKTYLCICDGQQETMYLNHVATLIKDFPRKVVKFNTFEDSPHLSCIQQCMIRKSKVRSDSTKIGNTTIYSNPGTKGA